GLSAQTIGGSEIYYKKTAAGKYDITAHVYRECTSPALTSISTFVISDTVSRAFTLTRTSISKLNDTCSNPCQNLNGASNPGFEKHTFTGSIDFNQFPYNVFINKGLCIVSIAIRMSGRDNLPVNHTTGLYYQEAEINLCAGMVNANSSPILSFDP